MKLFSNIYVAIGVLILSIIVLILSFFNFQLGKVSDSNTLKKIVINPGSIDMIANTLYDNNLIKDKLSFKIYIKLTEKTNLKAATYNLSENMGVREIVDILSSNKGNNIEKVSITIKEGVNMREVAKTISQNTNHNEEELYSILTNKDYLTNLINKYWFLDNIILDNNIYYSLEGYLYPDTYYFANMNVTIEEIIEKILDEMEKKITPYKDIITTNNISFHEVLTLASIVELEGITIDDRLNIVSVFTNRMNNNMNLGSDVTTYYGAKVDIGERDLYSEELDVCNNYNTRCSTFKGLPISPISNPSLESIEAVLKPINTNYYYFVADKNKKIYFSETIEEHNTTINRLKNSNLWFEY